MALPNVLPRVTPPPPQNVHPPAKDPQERFLNRRTPAMRAAEEKEEETPETPKP